MTFGLTIMATWYWCTDQVSVAVATRPTFLPSGVGSGESGRPSADPWRGPRNTCVVSLGWGTGHGLHGSRPRDRVLGFLVVPGGLGPPFRIR